MSIFKRRSTQPKPTCGCGHHLAFHDRDSSACAHTHTVVTSTNDVVRDAVGDPVWDSYGVATVRQEHLHVVPCSCRRYVGPELLMQVTGHPGFYMPPTA